MVIKRLIGAYTIMLRLAVVVLNGGLETGVQLPREVLERCGDIYSSIDKHVPTTVNELPQCSQCAQQDSVFPRRMCP
jgi:hypothetical protein